MSKVLSFHANQIRSWAQTVTRGCLVLDGNIGSTVGLSVIRATNQVVKATRVRVALKPGTCNSLAYYVFTAHPTIVG